MYSDDGTYPSLHNQEGVVVGFHDVMGCTYMKVEFNLFTGKKFTGSLPTKNFTLVKKNKEK